MIDMESLCLILNVSALFKAEKTFHEDWLFPERTLVVFLYTALLLPGFLSDF